MRSDLYSRRAAAAASAALALAAACGGEGAAAAKEAAARAAAIEAACRAGGDRALELAVADYVRRTTPKPERFLTAAGTDSALPDAGVRVLQEKGPTYYFAGGAEAQARAMLHDKGDYTTLLVVPRRRTVQPRSATIGLAGHYVGGAEDGRPAGERVFTLSCDGAGWRLTSSDAERRA